MEKDITIENAKGKNEGSYSQIDASSEEVKEHEEQGWDDFED